MRRPTQNDVRLPYGSTEYPYSTDSPHRGVDFLYEPDHMVYAPEAGKVETSYDDLNGNMVRVVTGNRIHALCHNSKFLVSNGQQVFEGQPVAEMGWTGWVVPKSPAGAHTHWALKISGQFVDPLSQVADNDDMTITDPMFRRIWSLSGFDVGPTGRQPTVDEVKNAVGRDFNEFMDYWLNTGPVKDRITKGAYYDQDVKPTGEFVPVNKTLYEKKGS